MIKKIDEKIAIDKQVVELEKQLVEAKATRVKVEKAIDWEHTLTEEQKQWVIIPPFYDVEIIEEKINKIKNV